MARSWFWKRLFTKIRNRVLSWIDPILNWFEDIAREIAKEAKIYVIWFAVFGFGAAIYIFERRIPIEETHHLYMSMTGIGISLGSIVMMIIQMIKAILSTLGLLKPVTKIRDKVLNKVYKLL